MRELLDAEKYFESCHYYPWDGLIDRVAGIITSKAPKEGKVLDVMCGPGILLERIRRIRPDLKLHGLDIKKDYVIHSRKIIPSANIEEIDVLHWNPKEKYDIVLCTAGIHHVHFGNQDDVIRKIAKSVKRGGFSIIADPCLPDYEDDILQRRYAATKLGFSLLMYALSKNAPRIIVNDAIDIMRSDINILGEYKLSVDEERALLRNHFGSMKTVRHWPSEDSDFGGDYYFILER